MNFTAYHAKYIAHELTKRSASDSIQKLASTLVDAQVDLNPHQVEAALFAFRNFIKQSFQKGYTIAKGELRRPFMVVDENGRSFDLVRQIDGVRSKQVKERLKGCELPTEKKAINDIRRRQNSKQLEEIQEKALDKIARQKQQSEFIERLNGNRNQKRSDFCNNSDQITEPIELGKKKLMLERERQMQKLIEQKMNLLQETERERHIRELKEQLEKARENRKQQLNL